jgi:hypothetical protein
LPPISKKGLADVSYLLPSALVFLRPFDLVFFEAHKMMRIRLFPGGGLTFLHLAFASLPGF